MILSKLLLSTILSNEMTIPVNSNMRRIISGNGIISGSP